ncbi:MAG: hypothetical protein FJZ63_01105 [Chlamydiae bacterium]|nr:hypothetical protein [Chlamydiota bacterium]
MAVQMRNAGLLGSQQEGVRAALMQLGDRVQRIIPQDTEVNWELVKRTLKEEQRVLDGILQQVIQINPDEIATKGQEVLGGFKVIAFPQKEEERLRELNTRMIPYFTLLDKYPHLLGPDGKEGEIQILRDIEEIAKIEKEKNIKVGIVVDTPFHIMLCSAVCFPNGKKGTYDLYLVKTALNPEDNRGAVSLTKTSDGRYVFVSQFRHCTRSTEAENIRGCGEKGEQVTKTLFRELGEECGAVSTKPPRLLGQVNPDSGMTTGGISIYLVEVGNCDGATRRDDAESSMRVHILTRDEVWEATARGYITCQHNGEEQRIPFRDGFTLAAISLEEAQTRFPQYTMKV